jgi:ComF family protein
LPARLGNLLFPDECRICVAPLANLSRIPICPACLAKPRPFIAEHACRVCFSPLAYLPGEHDLCSLCRRNHISFDAVYSYGSYEGTLRELIRLFKYAKIETLAWPFGKLMVQAIPPDQLCDMVIPMPMHWYRLWQRGFNQAELLSRPIARRYGLTVSHNLRRVRLGKTQAGLGATARRQNLRQAFQVKRSSEVRDKRILLIDDVLTTGSTLAAAAAVLKTAGAKHVTALTLARVPRRGGLEGLSGLRETKSNSVSQNRVPISMRGVAVDEPLGGIAEYGDSGTTS